jgi:flagellar hook-basal body complex protein FliE
MQVEPLVPDVAPSSALGSGSAPSSSPSNGFAALLDGAVDALDGADAAERAFAAHRGGLQEMVVERARADIALQIAASSAQRLTQSLQTVLGMQI